jgi:molybdate transport system substrate-binding protein
LTGLVAAFVLTAGCGAERTATEVVRVFAAASLGPVLEELARDGLLGAGAGSGGVASYNFAASSALARQVEAGAPADVFVSANPDWVDWLADRGALHEGTRRDGPGNELVVIAPQGRGFAWSAAAGGVALPAAFDGRLAIADPAHVPAGIYAKQALTRGGAWEGIAARVVAAGDARAALALVERGECAAGVVYRSDALASTRVEIVAELPDAWHDPVCYVAAATARGDSVRAAEWIAAFLSAPVRERLEARGFRAAPGGVH